MSNESRPFPFRPAKFMLSAGRFAYDGHTFPGTARLARFDESPVLNVAGERIATRFTLMVEVTPPADSDDVQWGSLPGGTDPVEKCCPKPGNKTVVVFVENVSNPHCLVHAPHLASLGLEFSRTALMPREEWGRDVRVGNVRYMLGQAAAAANPVPHDPLMRTRLVLRLTVDQFTALAKTPEYAAYARFAEPHVAGAPMLYGFEIELLPGPADKARAVVDAAAAVGLPASPDASTAELADKMTKLYGEMPADWTAGRDPSPTIKADLMDAMRRIEAATRGQFATRPPNRYELFAGDPPTRESIPTLSVRDVVENRDVCLRVCSDWGTGTAVHPHAKQDVVAAFDAVKSTHPHVFGSCTLRMTAARWAALSQSQEYREYVAKRAAAKYERSPEERRAWEQAAAGIAPAPELYGIPLLVELGEERRAESVRDYFDAEISRMILGSKIPAPETQSQPSGDEDAGPHVVDASPEPK